MAEEQVQDRPAAPDAQALSERVFQALLHRPPAPREAARLTAMLTARNGFETMLAHLLDSPEYRRLARNVAYPPGHPHSALVDVADMGRHFETLSHDADEALRGIRFSPAEHLALWRRMEPHFGVLDWPQARSDTLRYYYGNKSYPFGDAQVFSALLRLWTPRRIIKIGADLSAAAMLDTIDVTPGLDPEITLVQPLAHTLDKILWPQDRDSVRVIDERVQDLDPGLFATLQAGDMLFIDSSHVAKTGSDVVHALITILPRLAPGVRVHLHDIFYPFEYPESWVRKHARSWNEIYMLRAFLMDNPNWRVACFNSYVKHQTLPRGFTYRDRFMQTPGGAIWLERLG